jgi:hypothetical protein
MSDRTYCSRVNCVHIDCSRHQDNAPNGAIISIADLNDGWCFDEAGETDDRKRLLAAICRGTQKTNYTCTDACKALCDSNGNCAYCSIIADSIEEVINA